MRSSFRLLCRRFDKIYPVHPPKSPRKRQLSVGISSKSKRGGGECLLPIERAMPPRVFQNLAALPETNGLGHTLVTSPPYFAISPPHKKTALLRLGRRLRNRRELGT